MYFLYCSIQRDYYSFGINDSIIFIDATYIGDVGAVSIWGGTFFSNVSKRRKRQIYQLILPPIIC